MKLAIKLAVLAAANIGLAFVLQWYVLIQLGPGAQTDALFASFAVPQFALSVISGALMHVLVPLFSGEERDHMRQHVWAFLTLIGAAFGTLALVLYATAAWWVPITVPGFDHAGQALTTELTRIQLIGMAISAINGVQLAGYHARQRFLWAEFSAIIAGVFGLLALIWALPRFGVVAAAWISTLRTALQTLLLAPGMGPPVWPTGESATVHEAWRRIRPLLLGTAYYKTDPLVDRFLLSMAGTGTLSLYVLAQQIYAAAGQVMNSAFAAPLVPALSRLHKAGVKDAFRRTYDKALRELGVICLVSIVVLVLIGREILALVLTHGSVSAGNVEELWWLMIWLAGMFVGSTLGLLSSSSFYAVGDTTTPTRLGVYSYTIYIPLKAGLFYLFGAVGIALATTSFFILNFALQNRSLRIKHL